MKVDERSIVQSSLNPSSSSLSPLRSGSHWFRNNGKFGLFRGLHSVGRQPFERHSRHTHVASPRNRRQYSRLDELVDFGPTYAQQRGRIVYPAGPTITKTRPSSIRVSQQNWTAPGPRPSFSAGPVSKSLAPPSGLAALLSPGDYIVDVSASITPEGDGRDHFPPDLPTDRARRRQVSYSV